MPVKTPEEVKVPVKVNTQAAPELLASGQKLEWNAVTGVSTYVLATIVPGSATIYSEVSGISFTPAAVAGTTVKYSLRTAVELPVVAYFNRISRESTRNATCGNSPDHTAFIVLDVCRRGRRRLGWLSRRG